MSELGLAPVSRVALLAEGVDRNKDLLVQDAKNVLSPSSRRAWIEIVQTRTTRMTAARSPSSRRAWIEIPVLFQSGRPPQVALLAEGVDRNSR